MGEQEEQPEKKQHGKVTGEEVTRGEEDGEGDGEVVETVTVDWEGVVCQECGAEYKDSRMNTVAVPEFEFCPACGVELADDAFVSETREYKLTELEY